MDGIKVATRDADYPPQSPRPPRRWRASVPPKTALTPPVRMSEMRARLSAVRQATTAIRPALRNAGPGAEGPICCDALMRIVFDKIQRTSRSFRIRSDGE